MEPKRLIDELSSLDSDITLIQSVVSNIEATLKRILSSQNKSFDVVFCGEQFEFNQPCTKEEFEDQRSQLDRLVYLVLRECLNDMIIGKDSWNYVRIFASGVDPLDMQIEIIKEDSIYDVEHDYQNALIGLPLNEDNYQVKQELENDTEIETVDTF